jgi:hypothetical protein
MSPTAGLRREYATRSSDYWLWVVFVLGGRLASDDQRGQRVVDSANGKEGTPR